jgi:phosphoenolpyruvate carboxykinase (GTP)
VRDVNVDGLELGYEELQGILSVDRSAWLREVDEIDAYFDEIGGERVPVELRRQLASLRANLR